jgi:GNAT superfamily N-acetyltransferase
MAIQITRALPEHVSAVAKIMYEAFDDVARCHGFTSEIYSPEMAAMAAGAFVSRPDMWGVVAIDDETGQVIGHNFVQLSDAVAGVGPICVAPAVQARGIGRRLMDAVVGHALKEHGPMVRLVQEGFNMRSLSLYASLGFDVVEPLALMSVPPMPAAEAPQVRPLSPVDVAVADALCRGTQRVSRKNEIASMIEHGPAMGCVPHGCFRDGGLTAFAVPGFFGFGAAENVEDLLTTLAVAVGPMPPELQRFLLPTRQATLFREALRRGFKSVKVLQLMAMGPYEPPTGTWYPSIAY